MNKDVSLDCFGVQCPMPIIKTALEIKKMESGQVLEVIATDHGICKDMPAWCNKTGNEYVGIEQDGDEYRVYVKKA